MGSISYSWLENYASHLINKKKIIVLIGSRKWLLQNEKKKITVCKKNAEKSIDYEECHLNVNYLKYFQQLDEDFSCYRKSYFSVEKSPFNYLSRYWSF